MATGRGGYAFNTTIGALARLHRDKTADYGSEGDDYYNFRKSAALGIPPWVGAIVRLQDKISRLERFIQRGYLQNETVKDSLEDLAGYAIIALTLYNEAQRE